MIFFFLKGWHLGKFTQIWPFMPKTVQKIITSLDITLVFIYIDFEPLSTCDFLSFFGKLALNAFKNIIEFNEKRLGHTLGKLWEAAILQWQIFFKSLDARPNHNPQPPKSLSRDTHIIATLIPSHAPCVSVCIVTVPNINNNRN